MKKDKKEYFKQKLIEEKKNIYGLLDKMKDNDSINLRGAIESELSMYDNHPGDGASEVYDKERGMAFKENEVTIIKKIEEALKGLEKGEYGKCKVCGKSIPEDRLECIPYAQYCIECEKQLNNKEEKISKERSVEEDVLGRPFGYGFNDYDFKEEVQFDAEDAYQSVEKFNKLDNIDEYYDKDEQYVESVERISNDQYKNQL